MHKAKKENKALRFFVDQIRERLGDNLKQIILFGSKARGDDSRDSDYDCLIILKKVSHTVKDIIDDAAGEALYQNNVLISAIIISEERYSQQPYNPLLMNVAKEGVPL